MQLAESKGAIMHTPGPWVIKPDYGKENVYRLWDENGNYHDDTTPEAMDANAALIVAAPDLLDALKKCINDKAGLFWEQKVDLAKAAIAKAEGKS